MDELIFKATLTGLLHDIGKFAQRAGESLPIEWNEKAKEDFKDQHALYSDQVIGEIVPNQWRQEVRAIAGRHHNPKTPLERVVALADHLSTGERADATGEQPRQLLSIFGDIELQNEQNQPIPPPEHQYLRLKELRIREDTIFPGDALADSATTYKELWSRFRQQALQLKEAHENKTPVLDVYLDSLLKLMERFCWSIPSAYYQGRADVSLFDHSRMSGALAACLTAYLTGQANSDVETKLPEQGGTEEVALLVGGDISGVQQFIYTITSRGATSALRGRSMYLQLLTEVIARYVLKAVGMPMTNLIYAGGGHFYLLARPGSQAKLSEVQQLISRVLLRHHQGDLYVAMGWATLHANEFLGQPLSNKWKEVSQQLQQLKERRFAELGPEMATHLFSPWEQGGSDDKLCVVCQREHPKTTGEPRKCPACRGFEELGNALRRARYLCLDEVTPVPGPAGRTAAGDWQAILAEFGYRASLHQEIPTAPVDLIRRDMLALKDEALGPHLAPTSHQLVGRRFLVNVTPILTDKERIELRGKVEQLPVAGSVKPFEAMAAQSTGIKRLGVLRMDVDNLGRIFSTGLGARANLSRVAALSFAMSLFFEGWVEQIAESFNQKEGQDLVYSIYSGGDDLFFVGAWHLMPELADAINRDLARYTGQHQGIHLSGGIALAGSKYPLYQAADDAHRAEQAAKANRQPVAKNALNFLNQTIPWPKYQQIRTKQEDLVKLVNPGNNKPAVPQSLIRRLIQLYAEYEQADKVRARQGEMTGQRGQAQVYWGPGQWHSAYSLGRIARQVGRQNQEAEGQIRQIAENLKLENFTNIEWIGLAARWAELLMRVGEEEM